MNVIYLVIDSTDCSDSVIIKGVFKDKREAKLFVADYVLENDGVDSDYLELVKKEVTMPSTPMLHEK
ncbi:hypothetical protein [Oceanobacillus oncorhynchi]|uniref:hypothetical protein n=1 Tax=Oceanobacillus oncorhynchi TaxID=545501 RepID=UPI0025A327E0|nr:hypothetical protein [Oceanobacillus oncorhynchi]MDM8100967.1 hypothetical protein [Oceanobacillus oncorhynchi]